MNRLSSKYDALVGVNGRVVQSLEYTNPSFIQEVIRTNSEERSRVDFLCNTFGAQREHMKVFWRYRPYTQRNGEDIHFSMSNAIECDRQSRVILECEKKMREYGRDNVAISKQGFHFPIRKLILRAWYYRGVTFIKQQQLNDTLPHGLIMESWNSSSEGYYFSVVYLTRQVDDRRKVRSSEYPLSQIATAHISFFRAYFGLYTSTILRPAYQSLLRKMSSNIAMEFHGFSFAYSWNFMEFHLLAICEIPWNSMPILLEFHGTPAIHDS